MASKDINSQLRERIEEFVQEISHLVRESALEAVGEALGASGSSAGSRRKSTTKTQTAAPKATAKKTGKRIRRTMADIELTGEKVLTYVASHPGCRMEQISKALRMATKDLRRPAQDLIELKKLKTKGQRRATAYFTGGRGAARVKAKKKVTRRKKVHANA